MRTFLDFIPIVLFFITYKLSDIYTGTAVLMAATGVQMALIYVLDKKLGTMHKWMLALILIFGALTLLLQDERFIKWKPTVLYTAIAAALAIAQWGYHRNILKSLLGSQITLPEIAWRHLAAAWVVYCLFMAALNAYIVVYFSTDAWMDFKLWGYVFPIIFILGQGVYMARYLQGDAPGNGPSGASD